MTFWLNVVVAAPAHSGLGGPLTYSSEQALTPGTLVRVPLSKREVLGVVWALLPDSGGLPETQTRAVAGALEDLAPLTRAWCRLVEFTAGYYQRSLGEVALAALAPQLRELSGVQLARRLKRMAADTSGPQNTTGSTANFAPDFIALSAQQQCAIDQFGTEKTLKTRPALLFGATGSGKTEVYLRLAAQALAQDEAAQVLVMVPEINLTPQLQARFAARFAHLGAERVVALHSGLTPAQRLKSWLTAHAGHARLILGTRMAVLASMPNLKLILVDEEHDPSYKQQEGARYSARDLAVYRASIESGCKVLLGSATPSLESWQATLSGKYQLLTMSERIGTSLAPDLLPLLSGDGGGFTLRLQERLSASGQREEARAQAGLRSARQGSAHPSVHTPGQLPAVRGLDMNQQPKNCIIAPPLVKAIEHRIARGEQSLIFLNRRGYAPVLACHDCGWRSEERRVGKECSS